MHLDQLRLQEQMHQIEGQYGNGRYTRPMYTLHKMPNGMWLARIPKEKTYTDYISLATLDAPVVCIEQGSGRWLASQTRLDAPPDILNELEAIRRLLTEPYAKQAT